MFAYTAVPCLQVVPIARVALDEVPVLTAVRSDEDERDVLPARGRRRTREVDVDERGRYERAVRLRAVRNSVQGLRKTASETAHVQLITVTYSDQVRVVCRAERPL